MGRGTDGIEPGDLRDEDLYEQILTHCVKAGDEVSARELGKRVCVHSMGFERFSGIPWKEFAVINGISEDAATCLGVLADICHRAQEEREVSRLIDSPAAAARYAAARLREPDKENVLLMCLTGDLHCKLCRVIGEGTVLTARAEPYPIVSAVLNSGTHIAILAHNHLTGGPEPSEDDILVTYKLLHGLKNAGITLLDHLVIYGDTYTSMAAHGDFKREPEPERQIYCPDSDAAEEA